MNDKNNKHDNQDSAITPLQGFDAITSFIRQYLVCDDHQLTILALWIANTWCFFSFRTAPYLSIRSPEPQSGKSLCLQLLNELSSPPILVAGPDPQTLRRRLLNGRSKDQIQDHEKCVKVSFPLLLDDCHQTFNWSERQTLLSLLNCGSDLNSLYAWGSKDYFVFGPKAFAGNASLPQSLASRCIPIVLRRRKASDPVQRFFADDVSNLTLSMRHWLDGWARDNYSRFEEARKKPVQFPPALTPRQQLCAEPLLRIANCIGGSWPAKARAAVAALFGLADCTESVQLLRDVRTLFLQSQQPDQLPTRDLLSFLCNLENRPWSVWGSKSGQRLASLLHPLGIFSRDIKVGGDSLKGYRFQDFQDAWERYAGPVAAFAATQENAATT